MLGKNTVTRFVLLLLQFSGMIFHLQALEVIAWENQEAAAADAHIHHGFSIVDDNLVLTNFEYFPQRGVGVFVFPLPVSRAGSGDLPDRIKHEVEMLRKFSESIGTFRILDNTAQLNMSSGQDTIGVLLSLESFEGALAGDPDNIEKYASLGIRSITIIDNQMDRYFDGDRLTSFGNEVVGRMNKSGILIDISHLSERQMELVISSSRQPVMASHSCARTVAGRGSNLSDHVLEKIKESKSYVFVTFNKNDIYPRGSVLKDGVEQAVDHIEFLVEKIGIDFVGIGSDFQASGKYVPEALNRKDSYRRIRAELCRRDFSEKDVGKIMSGNFLKAMAIE